MQQISYYRPATFSRSWTAAQLIIMAWLGSEFQTGNSSITLQKWSCEVWSYLQQVTICSKANNMKLMFWIKKSEFNNFKCYRKHNIRGVLFCWRMKRFQWILYHKYLPYKIWFNSTMEKSTLTPSLVCNCVTKMPKRIYMLTARHV